MFLGFACSALLMFPFHVYGPHIVFSIIHKYDLVLCCVGSKRVCRVGGRGASSHVARAGVTDHWAQVAQGSKVVVPIQ